MSDGLGLRSVNERGMCDADAIGEADSRWAGGAWIGIDQSLDSPLESAV